MTQTNFSLNSYIPLMATVYAEASKHTPKEHDAIISDILDKAEGGKKEHNAHLGSLSAVLSHNYPSVRNSSPKYREALSQEFKNPADEHNFKKVVTRFSGIMRGTIPRVENKIAKSGGRKSSGKTSGTIR